MNIFIVMIQQHCLDLFRSRHVILEIFFLLFFFSLFVIVSSFESELASETFVFFTLYLYIPTQILKIFILFSNLFNFNFINQYKWLYVYTSSKSIFFFACLLCYVFFGCFIPIISYLLFAYVLTFFAINDLSLLPLISFIFFIFNLQLLWILIFILTNSIFQKRKINSLLLATLIFIFSILFLFSFYDNLRFIFMNSLSGFIRGNSLMLSAAELSLISICVLLFSSIIVFFSFINMKKHL